MSLRGCQPPLSLRRRIFRSPWCRHVPKPDSLRRLLREACLRQPRAVDVSLVTPLTEIGHMITPRAPQGNGTAGLARANQARPDDINRLLMALKRYQHAIEGELRRAPPSSAVRFRFGCGARIHGARDAAASDNLARRGLPLPLGISHRGDPPGVADERGFPA